MTKHCNNCGTDDKSISVPYIVHESEMARAERNAFRLWVVIIVCIALLFVSNIGWLVFFNSFEIVGDTTEYTQDGQGTNIIGNQNEVNNGSEVGSPQNETA